ncbi:MAG: alpha/beta hydrolase [Ignisphaera sp.]
MVFGASVFSWREIVGWLSSYGRVVAFDRPGFRLSERAWYNKSEITSYVVEGYRYPLKARDWDKGLYWLMEYRGFPDISNRLGSLRISVLVVHGLNDEIVHLSSSIELVELLDTASYSRLIVINECGRLPYEEKPAEFIQTIQEFIAKNL